MWRTKKPKITISNKPSVPPGEFRVKLPTNADSIRAMSDGELATTVIDYAINSGWISPTATQRAVLIETLRQKISRPAEEGRDLRGESHDEE